jgi:hypothetical protein
MGFRGFSGKCSQRVSGRHAENKLVLERGELASTVTTNLEVQEKAIPYDQRRWVCSCRAQALMSRLLPPPLE